MNLVNKETPYGELVKRAKELNYFFIGAPKDMLIEWINCDITGEQPSITPQAFYEEKMALHNIEKALEIIDSETTERDGLFTVEAYVIGRLEQDNYSHKDIMEMETNKLVKLIKEYI